jgi:hypothetical protein
MFLDFLYKLSLQNFPLYKEFGDIFSQRYLRLRVKCPLFSADFNETLIFSTDFRQIHKYQISLQSVQWESSCSKRRDGLTVRHYEANSHFSQLCEDA